MIAQGGPDLRLPLAASARDHISRGSNNRRENYDSSLSLAGDGADVAEQLTHIDL